MHRRSAGALACALEGSNWLVLRGRLRVHVVVISGAHHDVILCEEFGQVQVVGFVLKFGGSGRLLGDRNSAGRTGFAPFGLSFGLSGSLNSSPLILANDVPP